MAIALRYFARTSLGTAGNTRSCLRTSAHRSVPSWTSTGLTTGFMYRPFSTVTPNPPIELKTNSDPPRDFIDTNTFFKNRKVLLVGIVGAFTGVCDNQIPSYAEKRDEFKQKGIDEIAVVAVNDPAVLKAFGKALNVPPEKVVMLADFDGSFTRSLEMEVDLSAAKLGKRSKRYAMLVDNGVITRKWVEEKPGELKVSAADKVVNDLD